MNLLMEFVFGKIQTAWNNWMEQRKQKKIADANVEKDKEAVASGDLNAIAQAGEDTINGSDKH